MCTRKLVLKISLNDAPMETSHTIHTTHDNITQYLENISKYHTIPYHTIPTTPYILTLTYHNIAP